MTSTQCTAVTVIKVLWSKNGDVNAVRFHLKDSCSHTTYYYTNTNTSILANIFLHSKALFYVTLCSLSLSLSLSVGNINESISAVVTGWGRICNDFNPLSPIIPCLAGDLTMPARAGATTRVRDQPASHNIYIGLGLWTPTRPGI